MLSGRKVVAEIFAVDKAGDPSAKLTSRLGGRIMAWFGSIPWKDGSGEPIAST